jgi:hypothetical protein
MARETCPAILMIYLVAGTRLGEFSDQRMTIFMLPKIVCGSKSISLPRTMRRSSPPQAGQESKESPSSLERVPVAKTTARSGISWALPWAWRYSQVCRGPEGVRRLREVPGKPGGHGDLVTANR